MNHWETNIRHVDVGNEKVMVNSVLEFVADAKIQADMCFGSPR